MALFVQYILTLMGGTPEFHYEGSGLFSLSGSASSRKIFLSFITANFAIGETVVDANGQQFIVQSITQTTEGTYYNLLHDGSHTSATLVSLAEYESLEPNRAAICISEAQALLNYLLTLPIVPDPAQGVFEFSKEFDRNEACIIISTRAEALKQALSALPILPDPPMGVIEVNYRPEDDMGNCLDKMTKAENLLQELILL